MRDKIFELIKAVIEKSCLGNLCAITEFLFGERVLAVTYVLQFVGRCCEKLTL